MVRLTDRKGLWFAEDLATWHRHIWHVRQVVDLIEKIESLSPRKRAVAAREIETRLLFLNQSVRLSPVLQWYEERSIWTLGTASFAEDGEARFAGALGAAVFWLYESTIRRGPDSIVCIQCKEDYRPKRQPKAGHPNFCPICRDSAQRRRELKQARRAILRSGSTPIGR